MFQTPKDCPHEFRIQAVKRFLETSRRCKFTARELGIPELTLRGWKNTLMGEAKKEAMPDKKGRKDNESLLIEKEKRIQQLEEENLILKKSIGIFTKDSRPK